MAAKFHSLDLFVEEGLQMLKPIPGQAMFATQCTSCTKSTCKAGGWVILCKPKDVSLVPVHVKCELCEIVYRT
jgi:hypothetical protein